MKFSSYISVGKSKGLGIKRDGPSVRINLFKFSFCIGWFDIENILENLLGDAQKSDFLKEQEGLLDENLELKGQIEVFKKEFQKSKETEISLKKRIKEMDESLDELSDEITDLMDVEAENHELKDKIEVLENKIVEMKNNRSSSSSSSESLISNFPFKIDYHI